MNWSGWMSIGSVRTGNYRIKLLTIQMHEIDHPFVRERSSAACDGCLEIQRLFVVKHVNVIDCCWCRNARTWWAIISIDDHRRCAHCTCCPTVQSDSVKTRVIVRLSGVRIIALSAVTKVPPDLHAIIVTINWSIARELHCEWRRSSCSASRDLQPKSVSS